MSDRGHNNMKELTHYPLSMNQAKDLARDGKKRPLERGVAGNTLEQAVRDMEKVEDEEVDIFTRDEEKKQKKKSQKSADAAAQRNELEQLKAQEKHSMKLRSKNNKGSIVQPGKFSRDLHRHF